MMTTLHTNPGAQHVESAAVCMPSLAARICKVQARTAQMATRRNRPTGQTSAESIAGVRHKPEIAARPGAALQIRDTRGARPPQAACGGSTEGFGSASGIRTVNYPQYTKVPECYPGPVPSRDSTSSARAGRGAFCAMRRPSSLPAHPPWRASLVPVLGLDLAPSAAYVLECPWKTWGSRREVEARDGQAPRPAKFQSASGATGSQERPARDAPSCPAARRCCPPCLPLYSTRILLHSRRPSGSAWRLSS